VNIKEKDQKKLFTFKIIKDVFAKEILKRFNNDKMTEFPKKNTLLIRPNDTIKYRCIGED
jgi:hypothetical protein